jgi:regulation of enolase protein 1 (concanavalin A-like superfamily)
LLACFRSSARYNKPVDVHLADLPFALRWSPEPESWSVADGALVATAGPCTDLFTSPEDGSVRADAPLLLGEVMGDFQFSARVQPAFAAAFDAGALIVRERRGGWAKLAFESSPQGATMAVSVVTRSESDDANGFFHDGEALYLQIARRSGSYALHASPDGSSWHLIRHFRLSGAAGEPVEAGFAVQSPTGEGCTVAFSRISFVPETLAEIRA